jgi:hypothetical protein
MKKLLLASVALMLAAPAAFAQMNPAPTIAPAPTADEMKMPRLLGQHLQDHLHDRRLRRRADRRDFQ